MIRPLTNFYDVIVIGAGPAGGSAARELAKRGRKVLCVERSQQIGQPNYSTGVTPKYTIADFGLPAEVISAPWRKILLATSRERVLWEFPEPVGYILDFARLCQLLVENAVEHGADLLIGTSAQQFLTDEKKGYVGIRYAGVFGEDCARAKIIIDATGRHEFANSILRLNSAPEEELATGLEVLMAGSPGELGETICAFLGSSYASRGYAWIGPMRNGRGVKAGIGRYGSVADGKDLLAGLSDFLDRVPDLARCAPTEIHGGAAHASGGVREHVFKNIILVGDAAHQVNPLIGEGIRHALRAGRMAADAIDGHLREESGLATFKEQYERNWRGAFALKWKISKLFGDMLYRDTDDEALDRFVRALRTLSPAEAFALIFDYDYKVILRHPSLVAEIARRTPALLRDMASDSVAV